MSSTAPSPPFADLFKSAPQTVHVGSTATYHLHRDALTNASPFFASLLATNSSHNDTAVHLDTSIDLPESFDLFVEFLYHGTYTPAAASREGLMHLHASVYVLAERLDVPPLRAEALEGMRATLGTATADVGGNCVVEAIYTVYENTSRGLSPPSPVPSTVDGCRHHTPVRRTASAPIYTPPIKRDLFSKPLADSATPPTTPSPVAPPPQRPAKKSAAISDPMRHLLSAYCATHLEALKANAEFRMLLRGVGEFSEDLVMCISARDKERESRRELEVVEKEREAIGGVGRVGGMGALVMLALAAVVAMGVGAVVVLGYGAGAGAGAGAGVGAGSKSEGGSIYMS
ncbi:hypothetical protein EDC01DRAFT_369903 [Geopyxis carbonaria]|nr:hypothetical protein EDC01DRAFT_369903 [Geopyxis carbonaria]